MGVEVASGTLSPDRLAEVVVGTATLKVYAVNELGALLDADVTLTRAGKLLGRRPGPSTVFSDIPVGACALTVTYGPKRVSPHINISG